MRKKTLGQFFLLFVILVCCLSRASSLDLERREYENARDLALLVLEKYPVEIYTYVGVGRSVTPVVEVLRALQPNEVKILPLSNMYYRPNSYPDYMPPLKPEEEKRLFDHFERFLPTPDRTRGKKVLFLDFVVGGGSAVATEEYLSKFAREKRPDINLQMLIFSPAEKPEKIQAADKKYDVITTQKYDVINQRWLFSWFDHRSEFGSFGFPFEGSEKLKTNYGAERKKFLEHYKNYMNQDTVLHRLHENCTSLLGKLASN